MVFLCNTGQIIDVAVNKLLDRMQEAVETSGTPGKWEIHRRHTVDGRNPAPPEMYTSLQIMGQTTYINWCRISSINNTNKKGVLQ